MVSTRFRRPMLGGIRRTPLARPPVIARIVPDWPAAFQGWPKDCTIKDLEMYATEERGEGLVKVSDRTMGKTMCPAKASQVGQPGLVGGAVWSSSATTSMGAASTSSRPSSAKRSRFAASCRLFHGGVQFHDHILELPRRLVPFVVNSCHVSTLRDSWGWAPVRPRRSSLDRNRFIIRVICKSCAELLACIRPGDEAAREGLVGRRGAGDARE